MADWTVLAPGPSLKKWDQDTYVAKGPTVAVNNAILSPLPYDIWCCQDPPVKFKHVIEAMPREERVKKLIWCKQNQEESWRTLGFRTWGHPASEVEFQGLYVPSPLRMHYTSLTITTALARVIGMGAYHVALYGCDMAGAGYSYGNDNRSRDDKAWQGRWRSEKQIVMKAIDHWRSAGVAIELRTP